MMGGDENGRVARRGSKLIKELEETHARRHADMRQITHGVRKVSERRWANTACPRTATPEQARP
jgi:hypothetical protein